MASMDLGRLDLVSTTSRLRLELSSCAQFTTPAEDLTDARLATPSSEMKDPVSSWIERAKDFCLVLGLRLGDGLHAESKDHLLATLADRIPHAEVCLLPTALSLRFADSCVTSFGSN